MVRCPKCKSTKVTKAGYRVTKKGRKQRLQCQRCGRNFYKGGKR